MHSRILEIITQNHSSDLQYTHGHCIVCVMNTDIERLRVVVQRVGAHTFANKAGVHVNTVYRATSGLLEGMHKSTVAMVFETMRKIETEQPQKAA